MKVSFLPWKHQNPENTTLLHQLENDKKTYEINNIFPGKENHIIIITVKCQFKMNIHYCRNFKCKKHTKCNSCGRKRTWNKFYIACFCKIIKVSFKMKNVLENSIKKNGIRQLPYPAWFNLLSYQLNETPR